MIKIKSLRKGFRRCGVAHSDQWTEYADDAFTAEQLKALRAEPMLQVLHVGGDAETGKTDAAEKPAKSKAPVTDK